MYATNGGDGKYSYSRNSVLQGRVGDDAKTRISEAIVEKLDLKTIFASSKTFRIVDFGCSVGPNTFSAVQNIIESIEKKHQLSHSPINTQMPEFQVLFNDQTSNDFNTLFASLPPDRQYFAVGVPGSFYGRLFPQSSIHFGYSSLALHYLPKLPEELLDENSPSWNKGRIHYVNAPDEVVNAYANQFVKSMEIFLDAREKEIVAEGMLVMIIPAHPTGIPFNQTYLGAIIELLESSLLDMVKEGIVSEPQVDSFNSHVYQPSPEEMMQLVQRNGCFDIVEMELITTDASFIRQEILMHLRAGGLERMVSQNFGNEIIDEFFDRFIKKTEEVSDQDALNKSVQLLVVLKHR